MPDATPTPDEIRARHTPTSAGWGTPVCTRDEEIWPCDAIREAARADAAVDCGHSTSEALACGICQACRVSQLRVATAERDTLAAQLATVLDAVREAAKANCEGRPTGFSAAVYGVLHDLPAAVSGHDERVRREERERLTTLVCAGCGSEEVHVHCVTTGTPSRVTRAEWLNWHPEGDPR